jgi:hypothetical protein
MDKLKNQFISSPVRSSSSRYLDSHLRWPSMPWRASHLSLGLISLLSRLKIFQNSGLLIKRESKAKIQELTCLLDKLRLTTAWTSWMTKALLWGFISLSTLNRAPTSSPRISTRKSSQGSFNRSSGGSLELRALTSTKWAKEEDSLLKLRLQAHNRQWIKIRILTDMVRKKLSNFLAQN